MDARAAAEARDTAETRGAPARERPERSGPQALSLLALQRSAGNAAVTQLLGRGSGVQRKEEPAAGEQAPGGATAAPPTQAPADGKVSTDWFVDFDQMKQGGGAAGDRHKDDVLVVQDLTVHPGAEKPVPLHGFDAAQSGQAHLGSVNHPTGHANVSGNVQYAKAHDLKVVATLSGAADKKAAAAHQKQVAEKAAQGYVQEQFSGAEGGKEGLEKGAAEAANAALAAEAADGDAQAPTAKVEIDVVGRHTDISTLPKVDYDVSGPANVYAYVVVPNEKYKTSYSATKASEGGHKSHKAAGTVEHDKSGAKVDESGSASTTTTETADVRIKRVTELKRKVATSYVRSVHTAVSTTLSDSWRHIFKFLTESKDTDLSTTTTTAWQPQEIDVQVDGEDEVKKEDKHWYDSAVDFVKDKVGGYVKSKFWSWADKIIGTEFPEYRLIPGFAKDWAKRKITDLVWSGGKWLWHKISPETPEVHHTPEQKVPGGGGGGKTTTTTTDHSSDQTKSFGTFSDLAETVSKSYSADITDRISRGFEEELSVKTEVESGASKSKTDSKGGSVAVHGEAEHGKDSAHESAEDTEDARQESHTYTTDAVRIETGKPVIELTVKPK